MKIVIDTNMLVAYMFNKKSSSAKILKMAEEGKVSIMWHRKMKDEARVITQKISRAVRRVNIDLDSVYKPENEVEELPDIKGISKDPDDDKFLACAAASGAEIIISNDKHLLEIKNFRGIPIRQPTGSGLDI